MQQNSYTSFKDYFNKSMERIFAETDFSNPTEVPGKPSLRKLAERLGYKSASTLSMLSSGQRLPSSKLLKQLFDFWKTSSRERKQISKFVNIERKIRNNKEVLEELVRLKKSNRRLEFSRLQIEKIDFVKDWYTLVIFEMIGINSIIDHSPQNLSRLLNKKISLPQVRWALNNLVKINLIEKINDNWEGHGNEKYRRLTDTFSTPEDIPSKAIRQHHEGMIQQALFALEKQPQKSRQFSSLTISVEHSKIPEMKKEIQSFFSNFYQKFNILEGAQTIYQLNLQLFSHLNIQDNFEGSDDDKS